MFQSNNSVQGNNNAAGIFNITQSNNSNDEKSASKSAKFSDLMAKTTANDDEITNDSNYSFGVIQNNFNLWLGQMQNDGVSADYIARINNQSENYFNIVKSAIENNGFENPQEFIKSLSPEQLKTLQQTNTLAAPINPNTLTKEGALNLLLPRNMGEDLNNDGIVTSGIANLIKFPPTNAPQEFKDAWEETTKNMDFGTRITMELQMWGTYQAQKAGSPLTTANNTSDFQQLIDTMVNNSRNNIKYQSTQEQRNYATKIFESFMALKQNYTSVVA